jgi:hypothetical protein
LEVPTIYIRPMYGNIPTKYALSPTLKSPRSQASEAAQREQRLVASGGGLR